MSRILPKPWNTYPWYLRFLFRKEAKKYGTPTEPVLLWGRIPLPFLGFLLMQKGLSKKDSPLPATLRALVAIKVSQINGCPFCIDLHSYRLLKRGGSEEKLSALDTYLTSPLFSDAEKDTLAYAEAMTRTDQKVTDAHHTALKKHFNEEAVITLTALIATQNLSSKFNAALDAAPAGFCKIRRL